MKVMLVGSGGREHGVASKLAESPFVSDMLAVPGNSGIAEEQLQNGRYVQCKEVLDLKPETLLAMARVFKPDLTVIGPEAPLVAGVVDLFEAVGFKIVGPNKKAAQFEGSKAFTQLFMEKYGIPCPRGIVASTFSEAHFAAADTFGNRAVLKADGLASGKGAFPCENATECMVAAHRILEKREFGEEACRKAVVQEFLDGEEASMHFLCDGVNAVLFQSSKDHKRLTAHWKSPMTGGMGVISPVPNLDSRIFEEEAQTIILPFLDGCAKEGIDYRGILYPGVMRTKEGIKVLEFNCRLGDPETASYLTRLEKDLFELLLASTERGGLKGKTLVWKPETALTVVLAARGYPENPGKGMLITGIDEANKVPGVKVFHSGTKRIGTELRVNGGRVLEITALGSDLKEAQSRAREAIERIYFEGMQYRSDLLGM